MGTHREGGWRHADLAGSLPHDFSCPADHHFILHPRVLECLDRGDTLLGVQSQQLLDEIDGFVGDPLPELRGEGVPCLADLVMEGVLNDLI